MRNLATIAKLIIKSAITRKESRGLHYNTNYPEMRDDQKKNIILRSEYEPEMKLIERISFD